MLHLNIEKTTFSLNVGYYKIGNVFTWNTFWNIFWCMKFETKYIFLFFMSLFTTSIFSIYFKYVLAWKKLLFYFFLLNFLRKGEWIRTYCMSLKSAIFDTTLYFPFAFSMLLLVISLAVSCEFHHWFMSPSFPYKSFKFIYLACKFLQKVLFISC